MNSKVRYIVTNLEQIP